MLMMLRDAATLARLMPMMPRRFGHTSNSCNTGAADVMMFGAMFFRPLRLGDTWAADAHDARCRLGRTFKQLQH